jgi:hypothetical protein
MARASTKPGIGPRSGGWAALIIAAACSSGGCTICPDPFDYSGPVPNGSPPQNDFRARSGGILALSAAPKPWPPVVQNDGLPAETPVLADGEPEPVIGQEADTAPQQTSVLVSAADEAAADEPPAAEVTPAEEVADQVAPPRPFVPAIGPDTPAAPAEVPASAAGEPPSPPLPAPQLEETPGWRPRRRAAG